MRSASGSCARFPGSRPAFPGCRRPRHRSRLPFQGCRLGLSPTPGPPRRARRAGRRTPRNPRPGGSPAATGTRLCGRAGPVRNSPRGRAPSDRAPPPVRDGDARGRTGEPIAAGRRTRPPSRARPRLPAAKNASLRQPGWEKASERSGCDRAPVLASCWQTAPAPYRRASSTQGCKRARRGQRLQPSDSASHGTAGYPEGGSARSPSVQPRPTADHPSAAAPPRYPGLERGSVPWDAPGRRSPTRPAPANSLLQRLHSVPWDAQPRSRIPPRSRQGRRRAPIGCRRGPMGRRGPARLTVPWDGWGSRGHPDGAPGRRALFSGSIGPTAGPAAGGVRYRCVQDLDRTMPLRLIGWSSRTKASHGTVWRGLGQCGTANDLSPWRVSAKASHGTLRCGCCPPVPPHGATVRSCAPPSSADDTPPGGIFSRTGGGTPAPKPKRPRER